MSTDEEWLSWKDVQHLLGIGRPKAYELAATGEIQDEFMSPEEVMHYVRIGRTKCYELLQTSIPSFAIGRLRRVKKSDIDRWLESQRYAPWE